MMCPQQSFEKGAILIILLLGGKPQQVTLQGSDTSGILVKPDTCVVQNYTL